MRFSLVSLFMSLSGSLVQAGTLVPIPNAGLDAREPLDTNTIVERGLSG
jgi:hypothetical protein